LSKTHQAYRHSSVKSILAALAGIACIVLYFVQVMQSPTVQLLRPSTPREKILENADSFLKQLNLEPTHFTRTISSKIDDHLFKYVQYYKKKYHSYPGLPVGHWEVIWKEKKRSHDYAGVDYDFEGNLTGFRMRHKDIAYKENSDITVDDALVEAKYFLETQDIKTTSLVLANKDITEKNKITTYKLTLKNKIKPYPHVTDTYEFELIGDRIVSYRLNRVVEPGVPGMQKEDMEIMIAYILRIIVWLMIILIIAFLFIRRLRKDELEFKRALWLGIAGAIVVFAMIASKMVNEWGMILLASGATGLAILIGMLVLFPVAEAQARDSSPEKLEVMDLLLQGNGAVRETGTAILRSFFLTGVTLLLFGLLVMGVSSLNIGYIAMKHHMLGAFQDLPNAVRTISENLIHSLFVGLAFFCFWPAYLNAKRKISHNIPFFILLLALTFDFGGLNLRFFQPPYLATALVLPIALIWAYAVRRWDLTTVLISLFSVNFLLDLMLILLMPENLFSIQGMGVIIFTVLFFILGAYLVFRPRSARDYSTYVPGYVSRIAEKERFLKELEIARGVQMRFLPQRVPHFPSLEIVSLCQPAMEVGGDYYDFIQVDQRYMTVLIGDVSGKGVSAAFYMTMVKGIIKTLSRKIEDPAALLAEANEIFYENAPRDVFITIIYGIFDLQERILTVASAGHNPLIAWNHQSGEIKTVNPRGIALGLDHGERYKNIIKEERIPFAAKDVFVFYTDGVTEAMNSRQEIFGEERLLSIIKRHAHLSPQQLQEKIVDAVSEFSERAPQHDDFTMVVVKIR
jgi:hypothetical protein